MAKRFVLLGAVLLFFYSPYIRADNPVTLTFSPEFVTTYADKEAIIRVKVRVEKDPANYQLEVECFDSISTLWSSTIDIDGHTSLIAYEQDKKIPSGEFTLRATLYQKDENGKEHKFYSTRTITVRGGMNGD